MTAEESLKWIGEDLLKQCPGYIRKPVPRGVPAFLGFQQLMQYCLE